MRSLENQAAYALSQADLAARTNLDHQPDQAPDPEQLRVPTRAAAGARRRVLGVSPNDDLECVAGAFTGFGYVGIAGQLRHIGPSVPPAEHVRWTLTVGRRCCGPNLSSVVPPISH